MRLASPLKSSEATLSLDRYNWLIFIAKSADKTNLTEAGPKRAELSKVIAQSLKKHGNVLR
jgi:hypothetical protein